MKRLLVFVLSAVLVMLSLVACSEATDDSVIEVNEVTHSIFYSPFYLAIEMGYFADEGIKISLTNGGGADKSMAAILSGDAHIGLMGPEAAIYTVTSSGIKSK